MPGLPNIVTPPINDPPIANAPSGPRFSQAWTEYHQTVADKLATLPGEIQTGVVDGSDAAAGGVGEYLHNNAAGVGLSNGTAANVVTLALSAGDWDVSGNVQFVTTGVLTRVTAGVSTISGNWNSYVTSVSGTLGSGSAQQIGSGGSVRVSVSAAATAYLVAAAAFSSGGVTANGTIWARRVR